MASLVVASPAVAADNAARTGTEAKLPVSEIILYSSGVGYFQRDGQVDGTAAIDLRFKTDQINDLLKSLVVQDRDGGQVSSVTYGSRDPLQKTLKSFGLDLTENPTLGQLLNQARGEKVALMLPAPVTGTILGVEKKTEAVADNKTVESEFLNLLTDTGLQSLPLAQVQRIKFLNEQLDAELRQALEVLASGHDTQKKTVGIRFEGEGKRKVSVAYIAQTPVWKTSYRLVLDDKNGPYLQGWAIVENTSDEDWDNVRLSLVSGRPISFVMDLYQPLYTTRPVVQPELYSSLRPQVYGEALDLKANEVEVAAKAGAASAPAQSFAFGLGDGGGGIGGGGGGGGLGVARSRVQRQEREKLDAYSQMRGLAENGVANELLLRTAAISAQGGQAGELFQYTIKTPVNLARQKSAMLPIVSQTVEGSKVSIYDPRVQSKYPLNGFRLKNKTDLHLMQGPVTVFDGGAYAGDARLEDLAAGQERLISYALDIKTEVEPQAGPGRQELTNVKIRKGTLIATRKVTEEKTYTVRNRDQKAKTILIEHPFRSDWTLLEPKEPAERTRDVYRFALKVGSNETAKLVVREEKPLTENVQLLSSAPDVIGYYLKARIVSATVKDALAKAVAFRDRVDRTRADVARREQRVGEITQEQGRIRENMAKLNASSELYNRYVKKLDQQESELDTIHQELQSLKAREAQEQQALNDYLLNLDVS